MADVPVKITDLPDGNLPVAGDLFPAVRGGVTHKVAVPPEGGNLGILHGIPDALTLDAKAVIVNYADSEELGLFSGNVDQVTGVITIPKAGLYTLRTLAVGNMASPALNQSTAMYYRLTNAGALDGDYQVSLMNLASNMIASAVWVASLTRPFPLGAEISIVLEATANLGLFTFVETTFEVHLI